MDHPTVAGLIFQGKQQKTRRELFLKRPAPLPRRYPGCGAHRPAVAGHPPVHHCFSGPEVKIWSLDETEGRTRLLKLESDGPMAFVGY